MSYPHRRTYVDPPGAYKCAECGFTTTDRSGHPASVGFGADCPVAMREHIAILATTLDALRAKLDHIAAVGWNASCESAASDALEAEDATRLNRYAVRVARERDEARAELDRLLVERTGMDSAGWGAEGAAHEAFMAAENRRGGAVECPDCGRIRFVDGGPDIDLSPSRCQMCEREVEQNAARDEARKDDRRAGLEEAAALLDGDGFDPWPAVKRTVNVDAMDHRARSGLDAILDAVLADACREIRALSAFPQSAASRYSIVRESEPGPALATIFDVEGDL